MPSPPTLASLIRNRYRLHASCEACGHHRDLDIGELAHRFGSMIPVPEIRSRLRCTACRSRECGVHVHTTTWPATA